MSLINKMYHKALLLMILTLLLVYAGSITVDAENKTGNTGRYTARVIEIPGGAGYDGMASQGIGGVRK